MVAAADQRSGWATGDVLLPSMGTRSRSAARGRTGREGALPPLRQPATDDAADWSPVARFRLGSGRSRLPMHDQRAALITGALMAIDTLRFPVPARRASGWSVALVFLAVYAGWLT